jgi:hypothetical protein
MLMFFTMVFGTGLGGGGVTVQEPVEVSTSSEFFGTRFRTHLTIQSGVKGRRGEPHQGWDEPDEVLQENARQLTDIEPWISSSAERFNFDDYGKFRLMVSSMDGMGLELVSSSGADPKPLDVLIELGSWTREERLLAIGGGLNAIGYEVSLFETQGGQLLLGLGTRDPDLNVESIDQRWTVRRGEQTQYVDVEWLLWDGVSRLGRLYDVGGSTALDGVRQHGARVPTGQMFSFMKRSIPSFTMRGKSRVKLPFTGGEGDLHMTRYPFLAEWWSLYPTFRFERQVQFVQQERTLLGMGSSVRRMLRNVGNQEQAVNVLLRTLQTHFKYVEGPLRPMVEVIESGEADCDQLAMLAVVALMEMGFEDEDLVSIRWPGHLALGIHSSGAVPTGGSVSMESGRYVILDTTNYLYRKGKLVSRWGAVADKYGSDVTVGSLAAISPR